MSTETRYILAMTCLIPVIVGCFFYRKMQHQYQLIIYMMLMDAITETIDFIGIQNTAFSPISNCWVNAYMLISLGIFLYFAKNNGCIKKQLLQVILLVAVIITFLCVYKIGNPLENFYSPLLCFMYAAKMFVATDILSRQVTVVSTKISRNFWFWASCLFLLQNAYGLLVFMLYFWGLAKTPGGEIVGELNLYVNMLYYILFSIVLLLVPQKKTVFINEIS